MATSNGTNYRRRDFVENWTHEASQRWIRMDANKWATRAIMWLNRSTLHLAISCRKLVEFRNRETDATQIWCLCLNDDSAYAWLCFRMRTDTISKRLLLAKSEGGSIVTAIHAEMYHTANQIWVAHKSQQDIKLRLASRHLSVYFFISRQLNNRSERRGEWS